MEKEFRERWNRLQRYAEKTASLCETLSAADGQELDAQQLRARRSEIAHRQQEARKQQQTLARDYAVYYWNGDRILERYGDKVRRHCEPLQQRQVIEALYRGLGAGKQAGQRQFMTLFESGTAALAKKLQITDKMLRGPVSAVMADFLADQDLPEDFWAGIPHEQGLQRIREGIVAACRRQIRNFSAEDVGRYVKKEKRLLMMYRLAQRNMDTERMARSVLLDYIP